MRVARHPRPPELEGVSIEEYINILGEPEKNKEIKWIEKNTPLCNQSGNKIYDKLKILR